MIKVIKKFLGRYQSRLTLIENSLFDAKLDVKIALYRLKRIMEKLDVDKDK